MYLCEKRHKDIHYFYSPNIFVRFFSKKVRFFSFLHKIPIKTQHFRPISDILKSGHQKNNKSATNNLSHFYLIEVSFWPNVRQKSVKKASGFGSSQEYFAQ